MTTIPYMAILSIVIAGVFGCKEKNGGATVRIVVDHSDVLDAYQVREVKNRLLDRLYATPALSRKIKHTIILSQVRETETPEKTDSLAVRHTFPRRTCPWYQWPCKSLEQDSLLARYAIESTIDSLVRRPPTRKSYILRSLALPQVKPCKTSCILWIMSDMLENSGWGSFYPPNNIPQFSAVRNQIRRQWGLPENLQGSTSVIFKLNRCSTEGGNAQSAPEYEEFWNAYFMYVTGNEPDWVDISIGKDCPK